MIVCQCNRSRLYCLYLARLETYSSFWEGTCPSLLRLLRGVHLRLRMRDGEGRRGHIVLVGGLPQRREDGLRELIHLRVERVRVGVRHLEARRAKAQFRVSWGSLWTSGLGVWNPTLDLEFGVWNPTLDFILVVKFREFMNQESWLLTRFEDFWKGSTVEPACMVHGCKVNLLVWSIICWSQS